MNKPNGAVATEILRRMSEKLQATLDVCNAELQYQGFQYKCANIDLYIHEAKASDFDTIELKSNMCEGAEWKDEAKGDVTFTVFKEGVNN